MKAHIGLQELLQELTGAGRGLYKTSINDGFKNSGHEVDLAANDLW